MSSNQKKTVLWVIFLLFIRVSICKSDQEIYSPSVHKRFWQGCSSFIFLSTFKSSENFLPMAGKFTEFIFMVRVFAFCTGVSGLLPALGKTDPILPSAQCGAHEHCCRWQNCDTFCLGKIKSYGFFIDFVCSRYTLMFLLGARAHI